MPLEVRVTGDEGVVDTILGLVRDQNFKVVQSERGLLVFDCTPEFEQHIRSRYDEVVTIEIIRLD